jgi:hypothetical protein
MADSYDDDSSGAASFLSPSDSSSSNINEEIMALKRALMNEKVTRIVKRRSRATSHFA